MHGIILADDHAMLREGIKKLKEDSGDELLQAIAHIQKGKTYLSPRDTPTANPRVFYEAVGNPTLYAFINSG